MANIVNLSEYPTILTKAILLAITVRLLQILKEREEATLGFEFDNDKAIENYRPPYGIFCTDYRRHLGNKVNRVCYNITNSGYWKAEA